MTINSKNFKTTPSPYSWLIVAADIAINAERQQYPHPPESEETQTKPARSQFTVPSALQRLFNSWRMAHKGAIKAS